MARNTVLMGLAKLNGTAWIALGLVKLFFSESIASEGWSTVDPRWISAVEIGVGLLWWQPSLVRSAITIGLLAIAALTLGGELNPSHPCGCLGTLIDPGRSGRYVLLLTLSISHTIPAFLVYRSAVGVSDAD